MFGRIKDFVLVAIWGLFSGLIISYLTFAYIHFAILFKVFTAGTFLIIFVIIFFRLKIYSDSLLWAGIILKTLLIHFLLISISGSVWLYLTENFYTGFYETIALIILFPLITIGTAVIFLLRLIWFENVVSKSLEENINVIKFLLGFKNQ